MKFKSQKILLASLGFALLGLSTNSFALTYTQSSNSSNVYTWVDERGVKHYGDASSSPQNAQRVNIKVSKPASVDIGSNDTLPSSLTDGEGMDEALSACQEAKDRLDLLADENSILKIKRSNGSIEDLTDEERAARLIGAQAEVNSICENT